MRLYLNRSLLLVTLILAIFSQNLFAKDATHSSYPDPSSGYVSDNLGLLNTAEEERIEKLLWQVESRTKVEIIVVIINSISDYPETKNKSIEEFATGLFNAYGIGNVSNSDKASDNGVLFLIAKGDRKVRIELGKSYGYLRDQEAKQIIQNIILPEFRNDNYVAGIANGTEAIIEEFAGMRIGFPWYIVWVFVAAFGCLFIAISFFKNGKNGWGYVFIGIFIILILLFIFLAVDFLRHQPKSDSSSWSSGGMGGFGGGSSGGGGATGGW